MLKRGDFDWGKIFAGYNATVDWPNATYYKELADAYPDAKVILTERDEEAWYKSITNTIFDFMARDVDPSKLDPIRAAQRKMGRYIVSERTFGNRFDKEHVLNVYRQNSTEVKREVPKDKLLVFDAPDGWEPLCKFLGVPVPSTPYPLTNTTAEFRARIPAIPTATSGT